MRARGAMREGVRAPLVALGAFAFPPPSNLIHITIHHTHTLSSHTFIHRCRCTTIESVPCIANARLRRLLREGGAPSMPNDRMEAGGGGICENKFVPCAGAGEDLFTKALGSYGFTM